MRSKWRPELNPAREVDMFTCTRNIFEPIFCLSTRKKVKKQTTALL